MTAFAAFGRPTAESCFETDDIEGAFAGLAESSEPFDVWFRQRVQEITGVDLSAPMEGPPPEVVLDWSS